MKKIFFVLLIACNMFAQNSSSVYGSATPLSANVSDLYRSTPVDSGELLIFGGSSHDVFLGCLNCNNTSLSSIWNTYGSYGSIYSQKSIWNSYAEYGGSYSQYSPFNSYASYPPVIVDRSGNFYGYFTSDAYNSKRTNNSIANYCVENYEAIKEDIDKYYEIIFGY